MRQISIKGSGESFAVGKIVCLGRNYLDHIRELNNQVPERAVIFCKPASSIVGAGEPIQLPAYSNDCQHELELAVLIGKTGKNIPQQHALTHVAGYAVALDLTLRDLQSELKNAGLPWEIANGFDTSCPLSDFTAAAEVGDPNNLRLSLTVNGQLRQEATTAQMMRSVEAIIAEISSYFTLESGDIILTGTPAGVDRLQSGDLLYGEIERVGSLRMMVV